MEKVVPLVYQNKNTMKTQKSPIGVAGSLMNQLMSNNSTLPVVGKGATIMHYSDRSVCEVIEVSEDGLTVKCECLNAIHDKTKEGGIGHQNWIFEPTGNFFTLIWRNGAWRRPCSQIVFEESYYKEYESQPYSIERWKEFIEPLFNGDTHLTLVPGKTKIKKSYPKVNILFGEKDYHYDWEF